MTKDMRQILDSLNGKQIVEESSSESPFTGFRQWALNEAWGGEPASSPTDVNVFQDRDPLGDGMWHWSYAVDGHIVRSGVAHTEEEAYDLAGAPKEDVLEPASHMLDEEPVMHLLRPRGGTECGEPAEEDTCTAEINHVTCPACIEGHDEYMRQFDLHEGKFGNAIRKAALGAAMSAPFVAAAAMGSYAGNSDYNQTHSKAAVSAPHAGKTAAHNEEVEEDVGNAEDHLDRMFNHHMAGHDDFKGQYDFFKGVNEDEDLDEGIHAEVETGPAAWVSYLINGDASSMSPEDLEACDDWQTKIEPWYVVSVEDGEPRFTWSYRLYGGTASGGDVIDYIVHKDGGTEQSVDEPMIDEEDMVNGEEPNYDTFERDLVSAVTRYDRGVGFSDGRALGIYLQRVEEIMKKIRAGENWHTAVSRGFTDYLRDYVISFLEKAGHRIEENAFVSPELDEGWDEDEDGIEVPEGYSVYKNRFFTKRDYETSNIVAITAPHKPETEDNRWTRSDPSVLKGLTMLYRQGDVRYYGYL
jgi:hypothetical protein